MDRALIITGMHRSGTSLAASLLQRFGVDIGENLLGPGEGNPRGHFEDLEFVRFHEDWLHRSGQRMLLQGDFRPRVSSEERDRARRLIAGRKGAGLWGFKDPRTSLFLPFWREMLPEARFLLVFRHPIDVVLSLLRRGSDYEALVDPAAGMRSWAVHNRAILRFYRQVPELCYLAEIDGLTERIGAFPQELSQKLGLELNRADASELFVPRELRSFSRTAGLSPLLRRLAPEIVELFDQLRLAADRARANNVEPERGPDLGALEALTLRIGESLESADLATAITPALLATLEPEAVRNRRQRLEAFVGHQQQAERLLSLRDEEIVRLMDHAANLENLRVGGDEQMKALARHAQNLEKLLADREAALTELQEHSSNLEDLRRDDFSQLSRLEEHGRNLERLLEEREVALRELEAHGSNLEALWREARSGSEELTSNLGELQAELREIEGQGRALVLGVLGEDALALDKGLENREPKDRRLAPGAPFLSREREGIRAARQRLRSVESLLAAGNEGLARIDDLRAMVSSLEATRKQSEEVVEGYRAHGRNLEKEVERLEDELESLQKHSANLESEAARLDSVLEDHQRHITNLETEQERQLATMVELRVQAEEGRAEIDRLAAQCRELQAHASNLEVERNAAEKGRLAVVAHAENLQLEIGRAEALRLELQRHGENLEEALRRERLVLQDLGSHAENLQRELETSQESLDLLATNSQKIEASRERVEKELAAMSGELGRTQSELAGWREKAQAQTEQSEQRRAETSRLTTAVDTRDQELARHRTLLAERDLELQKLTAAIRRAESHLEQLESSPWIRMLRRMTLLSEPSPLETP